MTRRNIYQYIVERIKQERMLSISLCAASRSSMRADSDAHTAAIQFMGLLRQNEDTLVELTKSLAKRDKSFIQEMFTTLVGEWTPLHACTLKGARKLVKIALKAGVGPNLEMGVPEGLPGRCSPLHLAAYRGDVSIAQLLVQYGADLEKRDSKNYTPLHYAVLKRNTLVARKLLKLGADAAGLTLEERMFYKDDIDSRTSGMLCVPVKAQHKTNAKYPGVGAPKSKYPGASTPKSKHVGVGASNSRYPDSASKSKHSSVGASKYVGVGSPSSNDKSSTQIS